jgi:hypothetical protein
MRKESPVKVWGVLDPLGQEQMHSAVPLEPCARVLDTDVPKETIALMAIQQVVIIPKNIERKVEGVEKLLEFVDQTRENRRLDVKYRRTGLGLVILYGLVERSKLLVWQPLARKDKSYWFGGL